MSSSTSVLSQKENDLTPEQLQLFLSKLMDIEKRYGHELRNVKADRQGEVIELINNFVVRELKAV